MRKLFAAFFFGASIFLSLDIPASPPLFSDSDTGVTSNEAYAVTGNVLAVKLTNMVLKKPEQDITAANVTVASKDDPEYSAGLKPDYLGYWVRPVRYSIRKNINIKGTWIFLFMGKSLKPGKEYFVAVDESVKFEVLDTETGKRDKLGNPVAPKLSFVCSGDNGRSSALHVNQAGYLPETAKFAYLTQYCGWKNAEKDKLLDIDFSAFKEFNIIDDADGKPVYSGKIEISPACRKGDEIVPDRLSESRVWEMNFSDFKKPGRYRIMVKGVGVSYAFSLDSKAYNQVYGTLYRGMYHQRCGTALASEFTRFTHPACHLDDARVPAVEEYKNDEADFYPQDTGKVLKCPRGHHDAGDYGKYLSSGALFAYFLLQPYEVFPERLQFDNSPGPEAGNGIPDIIEEAKWELDWISNMQDADGLCFTIVKPDPFMSYEDAVAGKPTVKFNKQRSLWWKDIQVTADFAAILSRAARTPEFAKAYPEDAKAYLEKAKKAWDACMKLTEKDGSPKDLQPGHHYGHFLKAKDDYNWMAVELWLTTGEQKYHDYFLKHHDPKEGWQWGWWPLFNHCGAATRAYVFGKREGKDPAKFKACQDDVLNAARNAVKWQKNWATRCSFPEEPYKYGRFGWIFLSDLATYNILTAIKLVDEKEKKDFLDAAVFNADQELGNSADDVVSITGLGYKRPIDHVHQLSRFDGIVEPVPGIPMGFHPCGYNRGTSDRQLMASFTAGGLPIAYRYVDCWNVEQEFTVPILANTAIVYAYLSDQPGQKKGKPALKVSGNGKEKTVTGSAPFKVKLKAEAAGAAGKGIRSYYWDLQNEEMACDREFEYVFTVPGLYNVCCTVTDEDGWISYEYFEVKVSQPAAELPGRGEALKADADTLYLWHFDSDLNDAVGKIPIKLTGNAKQSDRNLMWMAKPSGKSIEMEQPEDGLQIEIPGNLIADKKYKSLRLEFLANYQEDHARGSPSSKIMFLECAWNCAMGVSRDIWAGRGFFGDKDETAKKKILDMVSPRPGWHLLAIGYDRSAGKGYVELDGKKTEFELQQGGSGDKTVVSVGGFKGFIDELRISAKLDLALDLKQQKPAGK
ncbi:MAG: hypothetical protein A2X48_10685 [Lentisphaerae bacterium GWF2_49_21]|nr:MAG: hypothetical protein A2X48_10685 [Lentisphaerae bacterium GWF2_49_21]